MQNAKIEVDETLPFGGYAAGRVAGRLIRITRALPSNWLGKRLMFLLRGIARKRLRQCVDTTLFGARLRLYTGGNLSEKRALFAPQFFDLDELGVQVPHIFLPPVLRQSSQMRCLAAFEVEYFFRGSI